MSSFGPVLVLTGDRVGVIKGMRTSRISRWNSAAHPRSSVGCRPLADVLSGTMMYSELCAMAGTGVGLFCLWRVLSRVLKPPDGVNPQELACRTCSALHAAPVGISAVLTVLGAVNPRVGPIAMSVSMGYFMHDAAAVLLMGTEKFAAPILIHHGLCTAGMAAILTLSRHNIWYAALLQWTECTIPIQFVCWLFEIYGGDEAWPRTYAAGRWLMAIAWVTMRLALMPVFFYTVFRNWSTLDAIPKVSALTVGPFLSAFNVGGLFKVILPGFPWWRRKGKQP